MEQPRWLWHTKRPSTTKLFGWLQEVWNKRLQSPLNPIVRKKKILYIPSRLRFQTKTLPCWILFWWMAYWLLISTRIASHIFKIGPLPVHLKLLQNRQMVLLLTVQTTHAIGKLPCLKTDSAIHISFISTIQMILFLMVNLLNGTRLLLPTRQNLQAGVHQVIFWTNI